MSFRFSTDTAARVLWSVRPCSSGDGAGSGCRDPQCVCSLCGEPIGTPEDDPRWMEHDDECSDCDVCRDQVPVILFRGEGRAMQRAQFHTRCLHSIVEFKETGSSPPRK